MIRFFIHMKLLTKTFQAKKITVRNGKAVIYTPPELKEIQSKYIAYLSKHAPEKPLEGAVQLSTIWCFPADKHHTNGNYKTTKPDTDNLVKMLKDCMTQCGFWKDDAQVAVELITKRYNDVEGILICAKEIGMK